MSNGWYYTPQAPGGYSTTTQNGGVVNPNGSGVDYYASGHNADGTQTVNNPNNYQGYGGNEIIQSPAYGGGRGSNANVVAGQYGGLAAAAQQRPGTQMDRTQTNQDRAAGLNALQLQQQAAQGNAPSAAMMQMAQANGQTIGAQMAAANSGRPGGNPALQNGMAQQGGLAMQGQNIAQGGNARANEMAQARAMYGQQAVGLQGLDQDAASRQATLNAQQQEENDKTSLDYAGLANQVQLGQLTADTNRYNAQNSNYQQQNQQNANRTNALISGGAQAAGYAGMMMA